MKLLTADEYYVLDLLVKLLQTPSPSGYTDRIVHLACDELEFLGIPFELTRRGAIRATLSGAQKSPDRAIVAHLDTLGAMVKGLKNNGRLEVVPIGHWNARFAEGARVTIFTERGSYRGSILPLKASGHTFGPEIDSQPVSWQNLEIRVDSHCQTFQDLIRAGIHVGDFVAIDPNPETVDESSPGIAFHGIARNQDVSVHPAPGRNVLQGARIGRFHLEDGADRQPANLLLGSDDGQRAQ